MHNPRVKHIYVKGNKKETFENALSTGSLALTFAYRKMCVESFAMPIIKSIVEKETYRKENTPTANPYPTATEGDRMET